MLKQMPFSPPDFFIILTNFTLQSQLTYIQEGLVWIASCSKKEALKSDSFKDQEVKSDSYKDQGTCLILFSKIGGAQGC